MIELSISMLLFFYMFVTVILLLGIWSFLDRGSYLRTFSSEERYIWHCDICTNTYVNSKDKYFSECPLCGTLNEKKWLGSMKKKKTGG